MKTVMQLAISGTIGTAVFVALVFAPAGTVNYWQGWVFLAVFAVSSWVPTGYLLRRNPAALQRRMHAGPLAETRPVQKFAVSGAFASMAAMIVTSALDHRFGWSAVPVPVCVLGDVLVAVGLGASLLVVVQNSFASANITVEPGQQLVTTGFYRWVRHPMYAANVIMMAGIPLALGSYWGLLFALPAVAVLVVRIRDEERLLIQQLDGYPQYCARVRYRLVPPVW